MTDLIDTDLAARLHRLSDGAPVPTLAPADDVRRGRGRLRRRRLAQAGAGGATLVIAAVAGLALGFPTAEQSPTPAAAAGSAGGQTRQGLDADAARELVRARGDVEVTMAQLMTMTDALEAAFGDRRPPGLAIGTARTWADAGAEHCPAGWDCRDADVADASRAKVASDGSSAQVVAELPQGVVVMSFLGPGADPAGLAYLDPHPDPARLRLRRG